MMKKRLVTLLPYAIVLAADFYLLPCLIRDTGAAMVLMLCVIPLVAFCCSVIYGVRHGFTYLLPVIAAILFFPTVFIYYNASAWVYAVFYGVITLAGNRIGRIFYNAR